MATTAQHSRSSREFHEEAGHCDRSNSTFALGDRHQHWSVSCLSAFLPPVYRQCRECSLIIIFIFGCYFCKMLGHNDLALRNSRIIPGHFERANEGRRGAAGGVPNAVVSGGFHAVRQGFPRRFRACRDNDGRYAVGGESEEFHSCAEARLSLGNGARSYVAVSQRTVAADIGLLSGERWENEVELPATRRADCRRAPQLPG